MRSRQWTQHWKLAALGTLLCLLAALFALEAKVAWYSPAGSARAQISYAKLRPAEPSKEMTHPPAPISPESPSFFILPALFTLALVIPCEVKWKALFPKRAKVSASPGFSTLLFFRPPPVTLR